jgi:hypothetical protein
MKLEQGDRKSICIISFSLISRDARVLRQIKYLSPHYDLSVIGYGVPEKEWAAQRAIRWYPMDAPGSSSSESFFSRIWGRLLNGLILSLGRCHPSFYERWYWSKWQHRQALEFAVQNHCGALLANDWEALPVAAEVAKRKGAKLTFDSHEYAPLELEDRRSWRFFFQPAIVYFIRKYSRQIDASVTVARSISEHYQQEFGFEPVVLLNAPESISLPERTVDFNHVRLVHHGGAIRGRKLESMIRALASSHLRFRLHFILVDADPAYLDDLKGLAEKLAPGRIIFEDPVRPEKIVERISEYEIGFYLLAPTNFNNRMALPNKFFDYIGAGLAVCIGPSPAMAEMVHRYGLGWVALSFEPRQVAETLNRITMDQILSARLASRETAKKINAETEMRKLVQTFNRLLDSKQAT